MILDIFTIKELEQMLAQCKDEMLNGTVTSINSFGTNATFSRLPVDERIKLIREALMKKDPDTYGRTVKVGWNYFNY